MKVAIVHDDLMRRGGAEQVVLSMLKAFPAADVYTMCYRPELTYPEFAAFKIRTSLFNIIAKSEKVMKLLFFPIGLICMKLLSIKGYDIVIISSTYSAKYVSIEKSSLVFIYTYTPFRLAWAPSSYTEYSNSKGLVRFFLNHLIKILRWVDAREAKKGHYHLSMTKETAERVKKAYGVREVSIVSPPVKCTNFSLSTLRSDNPYYLIVSRLEYYKNVDLAIKAFNKLGFRLIVVGNGSKKNELISMSLENIEFKSGLSKEQLAGLYSNCKAFIFPQYEDYGITPLEANASGKPVIAYGKGGVLETMIPYDGTSNDFTSIFFMEQSEASLIEAIKQFENLEPNSQFIRMHAEKFDEPIFVEKIRGFIISKLA